MPRLMTTRRSLACLGALTWAAALVPHGARADGEDLETAAAFIHDAGTRLAALNAAQSPDKQKRLHAFIDDVVDVEGIARFCIGRFWRVATPAQQDEYMGLFHEMLFLNVASRMIDYGPGSAAKITTLRPTQSEAGIVVPTLIERTGGAPLRVNWTVEVQSGRPRIGDVSAEGMSLRLTLRQDYTAFLAHNDGRVDALLKAMRERTSQPPR